MMRSLVAALIRFSPRGSAAHLAADMLVTFEDRWREDARAGGWPREPSST